MAHYDIAEAFQIIEEEMIASMSRNLKRHLKTEQEEGMNYSMWQAEQLAALNNFRKNNQKAFKGYFSTINSQVETILKMAHQSGAMDQETRILNAIKKGWKVSDLPTSDALQGAFFKINERKLNALIEATVKDMAKAETAMLRMADDEYRKTIFNAEVYYNSGAGTLSQCVDMATKDFLSKGISCIEYANGARVGIDSYASMALRTAQTRAYLQGESVKRDEWGVSTVIVNKRGVACPRCLKWVGRVYYDDVWGSTPVPTPAKYPLLSEAIEGGLYHPNCRDIHTTYFEGINTPPEPMTKEQKEEAARVYDLEQEQRYNERQIRKYKRLTQGSVDPENQLKYQQKLEAWQARQRDFVKANGDVLKRRYENEKLRVTEFPEPPKMPIVTKTPKVISDKPKDLTKSVKDDIMAPKTPQIDNVYDLSKYKYISDSELKEWKKSCGVSSAEEYKQINKHEKADGSKGGYVRSHRAWQFNAELRAGQENLLDEDDKKTLSTIRNLCKKNSTDRAVILDRFVDSNYLTEYNGFFNKNREDLIDEAINFVKNNMIGTDKTEKSIVSASYASNVLTDRDIHVRLHCPIGTHLFVTKNLRESEVLFHDGLTYEIVGVGKEAYKGLFGDKHRLVLNVVVKNNGL